MRIALVVTEFPAVSQTFVLDHLSGLLARGHAVDIHARRPGKESAEHPEIARLDLRARTHYLPVPPHGRSAVWRDALRRAWRQLLGHPARLRALWRAGPAEEFWNRFYAALPFWAQGQDYQLLHAHSGQNGQRLLPLYSASLLRAPLVVTFHGHDVHGYLQGRPADFYAPLFARAAALVVCSEFMRARLLALGAPAAKLHLIPNGIAPERYHWRPREAPQGRPVELLSVGRLVEFKGLTHLLSALAEPALARRDLRLQVVGDGPLRAALEAQARDLGLKDRVRFLGAQPREAVQALMDAADLYVAPVVIDAEGNTETQGVALLEALACGLPVIASAVGGIPETLGEAAAGLVPPGDPATLAAAIAQLLDEPGRWPRLSQSGRARIETHYQNQAWLDRLEQLYHSLNT